VYVDCGWDVDFTCAICIQYTIYTKTVCMCMYNIYIYIFWLYMHTWSHQKCVVNYMFVGVKAYGLACFNVCVWYTYIMSYVLYIWYHHMIYVYSVSYICLCKHTSDSTYIHQASINLGEPKTESTCKLRMDKMDLNSSLVGAQQAIERILTRHALKARGGLGILCGNPRVDGAWTERTCWR